MRRSGLFLNLLGVVMALAILVSGVSFTAAPAQAEAPALIYSREVTAERSQITVGTATSTDTETPTTTTLSIACLTAPSCVSVPAVRTSFAWKGNSHGGIEEGFRQILQSGPAGCTAL